MMKETTQAIKSLTSERDARNGGGCLLYYKDNICLDESPTFAPEKDDTETIWADINFHSQHLALALN